MNTAETEYSKIVEALADGTSIVAGQMFGKLSLKADGKAFVALQGEKLAFKLPQPHHAQALAQPGAELWDPSGKGRPMKEWVAVPAGRGDIFMELANTARDYVRQ